MDEVLDILTEFVPVETLVSVTGFLVVIAGGAVILLRYALDFTALPGPELLIGLVLMILGILLYLSSSFAGELLEIVLG